MKMNKPDWCNYNNNSDDIKQAVCIGYPLILQDCLDCIYYKDYKPKQHVLNPLIEEFFNNCCKMEKIK